MSVLRNIYALFTATTLVVLSACNAPSSDTEKDFGIRNTGDVGVGQSALTFSPVSFDFGPVAIFTESPEKEITLKNMASYKALISDITESDANYSITNDNCPRSPLALASGATCIIRVKFLPTLTGTLNVNLVVTFGASIEKK